MTTSTKTVVLTKSFDAFYEGTEEKVKERMQAYVDDLIKADEESIRLFWSAVRKVVSLGLLR